MNDMKECIRKFFLTDNALFRVPWNFCGSLISRIDELFAFRREHIFGDLGFLRTVLVYNYKENNVVSFSLL